MNDTRWPAERARAWYAGQGWPVGCNFIPGTAANQLEMWQAETFDGETIRRELGWAAGLGFNTVRVYLHDLVWLHDRDGFFARIGRFLETAAGLGIKTLFVLFDDCWDPDPHPGKQREPLPGIHNSRWVASPGRDALGDDGRWPALEDYVRDVITVFGRDGRVLAWDLYNENGNYFLPALSRPQPARALAMGAVVFRRLLFPNRSFMLLQKTFGWARSCAPDQPLTAGIWFPDSRLNRFLLAESDIITFHNYNGVKSLSARIARLKKTGRPLLCTEYMARTRGSCFETHLPVFKRENVGCYSWGLVAGKTNTIYSWQDRGGAAEPAVWFHDILRPDGTAFDPREVELIRRITGKS
jgi:hypothetical protein